jgi:hypothetical protein
MVGMNFEPAAILGFRKSILIGIVESQKLRSIYRRARIGPAFPGLSGLPGRSREEGNARMGARTRWLGDYEDYASR